MALKPAVNQVNLLLLLLQPGARGPRFHWRRGTVHHMRETHRSFARKLEEAQVVPLASPYHYYYTMSTRKERRSLQPILIDDNGTPATWTFGLVFQQAIDRQDRTLLQSRRTLQLYWNHRRYTLNRNPPTTTGQGLVATTTCLVGYTPLRLHTLQDTPTRHHLANRHLAGDRLRIGAFASHTGHQDYQPPS